MTNPKLEYYKRMLETHGPDAVLAFLLGIIEEIKAAKQAKGEVK
jgi:hypothetical protein